LVFLAAIYAGGLAASRFLKVPSLVGEIFVGILMGPNMVRLDGVSLCWIYSKNLNVFFSLVLYFWWFCTA